jgi:hypothetical protein
MKTGYRLLLVWAALLALDATASPSGETAASRLTINGFGTLGLARSDDRDAQYVRDLSQPHGLGPGWSARIDSVLGLQASYDLGPSVEGVVQLISRYHSDNDFTPEVSWAFLRYEPNPTTILRAGRLGTEFYMQADSRLVGYANLTVRPPPDYYGPLVLSYFDGVDAALATPLGGGLLRGKVFAGRSPERTYLGDGLFWDMSGSLLVGGHLDYQIGDWQVRVGQTRVRFDQGPPIDQLTHLEITTEVPEMVVADTWTRYDSLGLVYDHGPLQVQAMLSRIDQGSATFEDSRSGYVIAAYRTSDVTPYVGYSRTRSKAARFTSPPSLERFVAAALSSSTHADQHTWLLGARWDVRENLALKAQVERIEGSPSSVFPYRDEKASWDGDMTVFSLAIDFVF